jgi:nicotinamidase-related amidase
MKKGRNMGKALLLIDIQNDYFPGGKMELHGSLDASLKAKAALASFRKKGDPVIHVQHLSVQPGAPFFVPETPGVEIHENVRPAAGETVVKKHFPNSFRETPLLERLKESGIDDLVVCGMMTAVCVDSTVRAAFDHGFRCTLLTDACASRSLVYQGEEIPAEHVHGAFVAAMGIFFAKTVTVEEYLASSG